jgi:hypothetical protein
MRWEDNNELDLGEISYENGNECNWLRSISGDRL